MPLSEPGALRTMPAGRRAVLEVLKERGEATAPGIAAALSVTASAVRQHLSALEAAGFIEHREQRNGPGRPGHCYRLSATGDALFPRAYGELASELLDYVADESPELVDKVFERRRARRVENARARLAGRDLSGQVSELTRILDEDGYLADAEPGPDGSWRIVEHNCAILGVASRFGQACSSEIGFLRDVMPDAEIERTHHMMGGAHMCAYAVKPLSQNLPQKRKKASR